MQETGLIFMQVPSVQHTNWHVDHTFKSVNTVTSSSLRNLKVQNANYKRLGYKSLNPLVQGTRYWLDAYTTGFSYKKYLVTVKQTKLCKENN